MTLLEVRDLKTYFEKRGEVIRAVDGVSFSVQKGEVFGLVGESGCGKSVTSLSIMRLVDAPGRIVAGEINFDDQALLALPERNMRALRGRDLSMIFQQPKSSLDPVFTIGSQVADIFHIHQGMSHKQAWQKAVELLERVGLPDPERKARAYPHEVSGGQAQRVMIAIALALGPKLLIADEPTTALDVTVQAQILDLLRDLSQRLNTAVILITHDLGVVAEICDRVAVMYAGQIVEQAVVTDLFEQPLHPYTQGLRACIPVMGQVKNRLQAIPGSVPDAHQYPIGCRFADRCSARQAYNLTICTEKNPDLIPIAPIAEDRAVRCWLYQDDVAHRAPLAIPTVKTAAADTTPVEPAIEEVNS